MKQNTNQPPDFVYVQAKDGTPLMPTRRKGKVRWLLRLKQAKVVRLCPFTIRLLYDSERYVQKVSVGVDLGSKHVGISSTTKRRELLACLAELRQQVSKNLAERSQARGSRRNRKTRHRKACFLNRKKGDGWLPPSILQKVQSAKNLLSLIEKTLPVDKVRIEVGNFDIQKMENPDISGVEYQQGRQLGFENVKAFVLYRDGYKCRKCQGHSGDPVLVVHHVESRQTGGNSPGNLVTLCSTCHNRLHRGEIDLEIDRNRSYRDAAHMNAMKKAVYNEAISIFGKEKVEITFGYKTKFIRIQNGISKSHLSDARVISGNPKAKPLDSCFFIRYVPRHTRSLHVMKPSKGGIRRSTVASHWIGKSRLQRYDFVQYGNIKAFISGSTNGRPVLRNMDWTLAVDKSSVSAKSVKLIYRKKGSFIIQKVDKKNLPKPVNKF